jgi:hypothetical protein
MPVTLIRPAGLKKHLIRPPSNSPYVSQNQKKWVYESERQFFYSHHRVVGTNSEGARGPRYLRPDNVDFPSVFVVFVSDGFAARMIRQGNIRPWADGLETLSRQGPSVYGSPTSKCKVRKNAKYPQHHLRLRGDSSPKHFRHQRDFFRPGLGG